MDDDLAAQAAPQRVAVRGVAAGRPRRRWPAPRRSVPEGSTVRLVSTSKRLEGRVVVHLGLAVLPVDGEVGVDLQARAALVDDGAVVAQGVAVGQEEVLGVRARDRDERLALRRRAPAFGLRQARGRRRSKEEREREDEGSRRSWVGAGITLSPLPVRRT